MDDVGDTEASERIDPIDGEDSKDEGRDRARTEHSETDWSLGPSLTLTAASQAFGIDRVTLRRSLKQGEFPHSFRDERGAWLVPTGDLLPVAFRLAQRQTDVAAVVPELRAELDQVRLENAVLRERLHAAEAIALERQQRIEDLRLALRMLPEVWADRLTGGPPSPPALPAPPPPVETLAEDTVDPWQEVDRLRQLLQAEHEEHERLLTQVGRFSLWPFRRRRRRGAGELLD
jgi:hypothetical protein